MVNPAFRSATELTDALRPRKIGSLELFDIYASRIERYNPALNAVCVMAQPMDISVIGPLARSADDLRLALGIIAGPEEIDAAGWHLSLATSPTLHSFEGLRVASMPSHPTAEVDASVSGAIEALAAFAANQGATVSDTARPDFDPAEAHRVFLALLRAATSGRFSAEQVERWRKLASSRPGDDDSYEAQAARGNIMSHRDWLAFSNRRHPMRLAWAEFFRDWDVLLCPAAASAAFPHNQEGERWERMISVNGEPQPSTTQMFWAGYSGASYLPSTVAPIGLTSEKLPVGVQIVGPSTVTTARSQWRSSSNANTARSCHRRGTTKGRTPARASASVVADQSACAGDSVGVSRCFAVQHPHHGLEEQAIALPDRVSVVRVRRLYPGHDLVGEHFERLP